MFFLRCGHQLAKTEGPLVPGRSFGLKCRTILFLVLCFLPGGFFLSGEGLVVGINLMPLVLVGWSPSGLVVGINLMSPPCRLVLCRGLICILSPCSPPKPSGLVVGINLMSRPWPGASPKFSGCGHQLDVLSPCSGRSDTPSQLFSSPLPCLGLLGKSTEGPFVLPPWTVLPPPGPSVSLANPLRPPPPHLQSPWQIHGGLFRPPPVDRAGELSAAATCLCIYEITYTLPGPPS